MAKDVVIDTNIMVQSGDTGSKYHEQSRDFLYCVLGSSLEMCVDHGFDLGNAATTSSLIGYEYNRHLPIGSPGHAFLLQMIDSQRLKFVNRMPSAAVNRIISALPIKSPDKNFVRVAYNSKDRTLVSHDYQDFTATNRKTIATKLGVRVLDASEYPCKTNP